jgi:hypothetical protein
LYLLVVSPRDYRAHRGIGNTVDADMGLQSADAIKIRFRKHFGTDARALKRVNKSWFYKKGFIGLERTAAYLPEDGKLE